MIQRSFFYQCGIKDNHDISLNIFAYSQRNLLRHALKLRLSFARRLKNQMSFLRSYFAKMTGMFACTYTQMQGRLMSTPAFITLRDTARQPEFHRRFESETLWASKRVHKESKRIHSSLPHTVTADRPRHRFVRVISPVPALANLAVETARFWSASDFRDSVINSLLVSPGCWSQSRYIIIGDG